MFSFGPRSLVTVADNAVTVPAGCRFIEVDTSAGSADLRQINGADFADGDVIAVANAGGTNTGSPYELTMGAGGNLRTGNKVYHLPTSENVVTFVWHAATGKFDTVATGTATLVSTLPA